MPGVVEVLAGLYYSLAGVLVFKKLVSDGEYYDMVKPDSVGRPEIDDLSLGHGLLGFSAGLYGFQKIPDSGTFNSNEGAYTFKLPWEVHLKRNFPPEALYDEDDAFWLEMAESRRQKFANDHPGIILPPLPFFKLSMPDEVYFEIRGEWWSVPFGPGETVFHEGSQVPAGFLNEKILPFTMEFKGTKVFKEVTLGHMSNINSQDTGQVKLGEGPSQQSVTPEERPIFYKLINNPDLSVVQNWPMTFRNVHMVAVNGTKQKDLAVWFDYMNPDGVNFTLNPKLSSPDNQVIDLDWW